MAVSVSKVVLEMTKIIQKIKPTALVVYGDRYETFAASVAGHENNLIVAHIEGGDITNGGTHDDNLRHAITKLSHLHFPTNKLSYKKILSLGEETWRVNMVGFSALDLIKNNDFTKKNIIIKKYNLDKKEPIILFTLHPMSFSISKTKKEINSSTEALKKIIKLFRSRCIITFPNSDAGSEYILEKLRTLKNFSNKVTLHRSLGSSDYWGILDLVNYGFKVICVGNSSSGIKETTAFGCPTINIGDRQKGRLAGKNILHSHANPEEIFQKIKRCIKNNKFYDKFKNKQNPYGDGETGKKIVSVLNKVKLNEKYLIKKNI